MESASDVDIQPLSGTREVAVPDDPGQPEHVRPGAAASGPAGDGRGGGGRRPGNCRGDRGTGARGRHRHRGLSQPRDRQFGCCQHHSASIIQYSHVVRRHLVVDGGVICPRSHQRAIARLVRRFLMSRLLAGPPLTRTDTRVDFDVWSTTATLVVTDPDSLNAALSELDDELAGIDATCSRFRSDSEINRVLATPGRDAQLSPVLNAAITAALGVAAATDYLVDPTVAAAVIAQGYDSDIAAVVARAMTDGAIGNPAGRPAPGAWRIRHDPGTAVLHVPAGVGINLVATAMALAADRAATRIADATGSGVLVGLGGDIAVAGDAPAGGWRIAIAEDHRGSARTHQTVSIIAGGLATSSTTVRRWRTSSGWAHHIVDPRTGENPAPLWRTASVAAACCVDANAAATAAIVLGADAPHWLVTRGLPALLIDINGSARALAGWPASEEAA